MAGKQSVDLDVRSAFCADWEKPQGVEGHGPVTPSVSAASYIRQTTYSNFASFAINSNGGEFRMPG